MAGYSGDGSYQRLIADIYGMNKNEALVRNYKEYKEEIIPSQIITENHIQFVRSGRYGYDTGIPEALRLNGYHWIKKVYLLMRSNYLFFDGYALRPQSNYYKGYGFSVRCVGKCCKNILLMLR